MEVLMMVLVVVTVMVTVLMVLVTVTVMEEQDRKHCSAEDRQAPGGRGGKP